MKKLNKFIKYVRVINGKEPFISRNRDGLCAYGNSLCIFYIDDYKSYSELSISDIKLKNMSDSFVMSVFNLLENKHSVYKFDRKSFDKIERQLIDASFNVVQIEDSYIDCNKLKKAIKALKCLPLDNDYRVEIGYNNIHVFSGRNGFVLAGLRVYDDTLFSKINLEV